MLKQQRKTDSRPSPIGRSTRAGSGQVAAAQLNPKPAVESTATIGAAITFKGDVTGKGDVFVSGTVEGSVDLSDNEVTVEESGYVKGSIMAKNVRVKGKVVGDIEAVNQLTISSTGTVQGTIIAHRMQVEDGAKFMGRIDMDFDEGFGPARPVSSPAN